MGVLEEAAKSKALERISKIIQRPDQLEKVEKALFNPGLLCLFI